MKLVLALILVVSAYSQQVLPANKETAEAMRREYNRQRIKMLESQVEALQAQVQANLAAAAFQEQLKKLKADCGTQGLDEDTLNCKDKKEN